MKLSKLSATLAFIFAATFVMGQSAQAQTQTETQNTVSGKLTQTGIALKGTSDYETIRQFILSRPSRFAKFTEVLGDVRTAPPSFQTSLTSAVHSAADFGHIQPEGVPNPVPGPLTPPPSGNHAVGDTYTVTSTSGGYTQEWDYNLRK